MSILSHAEESPKDYSERFAKQVQDMIDAGELNLTVADEAVERVIKRLRTTHPSDH
jgi:polyhydroxyalkanoate synthesis regulator phasin